MGQYILAKLPGTIADNIRYAWSEAIASVDLLTEAQIQEGLDLVLQHRTAILIAHRLSTVRHAGRIIVVDRGKIVEEGNTYTLTCNLKSH
jgi:ABC-type multidrug transport system fused ATPase/permease subunit